MPARISTGWVASQIPFACRCITNCAAIQPTTRQTPKWADRATRSGQQGESGRLPQLPSPLSAAVARKLSLLLQCASSTTPVGAALSLGALQSSASIRRWRAMRPAVPAIAAAYLALTFLPPKMTGVLNRSTGNHRWAGRTLTQLGAHMANHTEAGGHQKHSTKSKAYNSSL